MYGFFLFILVGCEGFETEDNISVFTETIVHQPIHEDCSISLDLIHNDPLEIKIGYSGACKMLNIFEYTKYIKRVLKTLPINTQKNVKMIYINSYETDGVLTQNLLNKILDSESWSLTHENCNMENLDKEFNIFNNREKYLYKIEEIITKEFGRIEKTEFLGIKPYKQNTFKIQKEKCYPDSFGVVIYKIFDLAE